MSKVIAEIVVAADAGRHNGVTLYVTTCDALSL